MYLDKATGCWRYTARRHATKSVFSHKQGSDIWDQALFRCRQLAEEVGSGAPVDPHPLAKSGESNCPWLRDSVSVFRAKLQCGALPRTPPPPGVGRRQGLSKEPFMNPREEALAATAGRCFSWTARKQFLRWDLALTFVFHRHFHTFSCRVP